MEKGKLMPTPQIIPPYYPPPKPTPPPPPDPPKPAGETDLVDLLIAYETGELNQTQTAALFQRLVDSGLIWLLQGSYTREARRLIEAGQVIVSDEALEAGYGKYGNQGE